MFAINLTLFWDKVLGIFFMMKSKSHTTLNFEYTSLG